MTKTEPHHPTDPEADHDAGDDAIIGKAFNRSLLAFAIIGVGIGALILLNREKEPEEIVKEKEVGVIKDVETDVETLPEVRFTDVTSEAGIDFVHENGATADKLLPETMGGGCAFFDYDRDGDEDLFLVNGRTWPHLEDGARVPGNRLYANDGAGHFTDMTEGSGLEGGTFGMGVAVADIDGNGWIDVFTTGIGGNRLYLNQGAGKFVDATASSGLAGDGAAWTTSAGFFDMDGDEDLDLFVCSYVRWSREIDQEVAYSLNGKDPAYGPPMNYGGTFSSLYRNEGGGRFTDVSETAGIQVRNSATGEPMGKALGVAFRDIDGDGDEDIFVANDTVQNHLFLNNGDGTFEESGAGTGFGYDRNGGATGAMGIDIGDFRGDGSFGVCIGNFANEMSSLFVKHPSKLRFSDDAIGEGIGSPSRLRLSFGMFFFDYDLDGRLDLLQVNGHLEETISENQASQEYEQPPQLFWNQGPDQRSCFVEVPPATAGDLSRKLVGRGSAYADIDLDGDLDVLMMQVGRAPVLLRNDQALGRHWLRVRLQQPGMNPDAIGATLELTTPHGALRRKITPTRSYLSQSELPMTFGLGAETPATLSLLVRWPDGSEQVVDALGSVDGTLTVKK
ncbi:ASPIC and UnbV [Planctomycetes bacterium Poly30]|uniref:ASPIC and UnbV n=1 Tax=Saltatorellus ferox TaxID=2528018 RepID=A0A518EP91_9BACT|nr:ASPIC and UnbV [Planctomycetes bacterium Poly30]